MYYVIYTHIYTYPHIHMPEDVSGIGNKGEIMN